MSVKNIKLDGYLWILENGEIDFGFWFGDGDEPISFKTSIKESIRQTLESYALVDGCYAQYHLEDMKKLSRSLQSAKNIIDHEVKRMEGVETND